MRSAIYKGKVFHKRFAPRVHSFSYPLYMVMLDLDELEDVQNISRLCGQAWWSPLRFKRSDFHGDPNQSIKSEVYLTVKDQLGIELDGPVHVLNQWRCFGFNFNPLSTYYCFSRDGSRLVAVVAEVTNTPWLERRAYALPITDAENEVSFDKDFTVSPFNPINLRYRWLSTRPDSHLSIKIDTYHNQTHSFYAAMSLERTELSKRSLRRIVSTFPFSTYRVVSAIYWEALKLYLKGVPFLGKDKRLA